MGSIKPRPLTNQTDLYSAQGIGLPVSAVNVIQRSGNARALPLVQACRERWGEGIVVLHPYWSEMLASEMLASTVKPPPDLLPGTCR